MYRRTKARRSSISGKNHARIGKTSNPNENFGQHGKATKNKSRAENNEMKAFNDSQKLRARMD